MESSVAHHQEIGRANSMENMLVSDSKQNQQERKTKVPQQEQALKCPRCDSINTKFCYYNNYSLSQPRYFCKSCRRYWTKGGTLRNVPVGGGCRKTKRSLSSSSSSSNSKKTQFDNHTHLNPNYDSIDLNLAFARLQKQSNGQLGFDHYDHEFSSILGNPQFDILGNPNGFYGNLGEVETYCGDQMILPYNYKASTDQAATMKQELSDFGSEKSKILYGFPWINGGIGEFDYGRESTSWNNIHGISGSSSSWHGVLNSPLM